jgi:iron complex transport system substrate-binding protein
LRLLGTALHREQRAETLARLAEALLAVPPQSGPPRRVAYARGSDALQLAAPGTGATEVFARLGWQVLAPPGEGRFRPAKLPDVAALDPDILVFADPAMRDIVARSPEWRALRAVREGHAYAAPKLPFGWIEEPPSLNQLLGVAWLAGGDAVTLAATFNAVVYGHVLTADELRSVAGNAQPLPP